MRPLTSPYDDTSTGLFSQTSAWHNILTEHMEDPQDSTIYNAFVDHGVMLTNPSHRSPDLLSESTKSI